MGSTSVANNTSLNTSATLKHIKESLKLKQNEMAQLCGLGISKRTTYLNYESGKTAVTVDVLAHLSEALSISIDEFICSDFVTKYPPSEILNRMAKKIIVNQKIQE